MTSSAAGTFNGNIAHTSTGAATINKAVTGNVAAPTPTITITPTTALSFATTTGTPSAEQSYIVSAANLTANLTLTAPTGYEISLTTGAYTGTGANTLTLTPTSGAVASTTIYVRLTGAAAGTFGSSGTPFNITHSSTGATTANKPVYGTVTNPTITTGTVSPTAVCATADASLTINFTTSGPFNGTYSAQLSNTGGTFSTFTNLVVTGSTATSLTVTIPAGTASSTGYKVRVSNSSPTVTGAASAAFIIVNNPTVTVAPSTTQNNSTAANGATLTATETPAAVSRQWYYSATSGGPYTTAISGATAVTYTPNFATAGTYFVVVQSTFAACGSVTSGQVQINVVDPVLTVNPAALNSFSTTVGTASVPQTYVLTGTNLSTDVTVTPPNGYEIALTSGGTYRNSGTPTTVFKSNATAGQTLYVRLAAATPAGTYGTPAVPFYITNATTGATTQQVAVDGIVAALTPAIAVANTPLSIFTATVGAPSVAQSYTLTPTALAAPITVTAPAGYEVSLTAGSGYGTSVAASQTATTTIYVRLTGTALGVYNGNITNVSGSVSQNVAVNGAVSPTPVAGDPGLLVLEEDFDYPTTTVLTNTSNYNQLTGGSTNSITVTGSSLSFDQYGSPARVGASVTIENGQDVARGFSVPASTTDFYASTLVNVASTGGSDYFFALMPTATTANFIARVYVKSSGGGVQFGIAYSSNTPVYAATVYPLSTTHTVVVRYIKNPGALDDVLELYVLAPLPTGGVPQTKPSNPSATAPGYSTAEATPGAVAIRQNVTGQAITLDGIRVGTGWGAVVGRPVYTAASAIIIPGYYYDVTVNNANTLSLAGPVTVENQLTLTKGLVNTTADNLLTLAATATVTASPANTFAPLSFVSGPLSRQTPAVGSTPTDFMFPVGKAGAYRPLTLNVANQAATTYTAEQLEGAPSASSLPTGVTRVSAIRTYTLTPNVQPIVASSTFQASLTIPFGPSDYVNDPATLVMVKRPTTAAAWENLGNAANTGISTVGAGDNKRSVAGTLTSTPFSSFSEFALATTNTDATINPLSASAGTPLPVELTSFSAQRQADKEVAVKWATASEKNSAYFDVQRSLDGREFATVATVRARGTSSQSTAYTSLDKAAPAAQLYYRLRQVDLDGTVAYSPVVLVTGAARATVLLYPNPATAELHVVAPTATPYRVLNLLGQAVLSGATTESTTLNVRTLPAGAYLLELQTAQGRHVSKFIKE